MKNNESIEKTYQVEKLVTEVRVETVQRVYSVEVLPHLKESSTNELLLSGFGTMFLLLLLVVAFRKKVKNV